MSTLGINALEGLHTEYSIDFDGVTNKWDNTEIINVSNLSNSGDTIGNKRKISDLTFSLYDADGSIWDDLGHGTTAFGKSISMTITVGGDYGVESNANGQEIKWLGTTGGDQFAVHEGEIVNVSRKRNLITIRTQNKLNQINKLKWQMPLRVRGFQYLLGSINGSQAFYKEIISAPVEDHWNNSILKHSAFNISENGEVDIYAHLTEGLNFSANQGTGIHDYTGTGISSFLGVNFDWMDTPFHMESPAKKFKGTFLGTFIGTINSEESAKSFGYTNQADADANNKADDLEQDTGTYEIGKARLTFGSTFPINEGTVISESGLIKLSGDPTAVIRHCLFGIMVSDFLDEDEDMGDSFGSSQKIVAFQTFEDTIDPDDSKVEGYINDGLQNTSSIFYVSSNNQFEMSVYGPYDFSQTLDVLGADDIIESSFNNDINDFYNRVELEYGYDFTSKQYLKKEFGTLPGWSVLNDRTLSLSSKWIKNDNQAVNLVTQQISRYEKTSPEINLTLSLKSAGREISGLFSVEDPDSFVGTKIVQAVEYSKDFSNGRKVNIRALDGESLFRKRGYAKWEDNGLAFPVDNDSRSGWADGSGEFLEVNNINENLYGTAFVWW